jgi:hypothetical protein
MSGPVGLSTVAISGVIGAVLGWVAEGVAQATGWWLIPARWLIVAALGVVALMAWTGALASRRRRKRGQPMPVKWAQALVAGSQAALVGGAVLGGYGLVQAGFSVPDWAIDHYRRRFFIFIGLALVAVVMAVGGWLWQRALRD